jgi:hypothetical protein
MRNKNAYIITLIIVIVIAILAFALFGPKRTIAPTEQPAASNNVASTNTKTFSLNFLTFTYLDILLEKEEGKTVYLNHSVATEPHPDYCDFQGNAPEKNSLTDFNANFTILDLDMKNSMKEKEGEDFIKNSFKGDTITKSEGYVDPYEVGMLKGYRITKGIEGCGVYSYYFPLSSNQTLLINRIRIPELTLSSSKDMYLAIPGVISPQKEEEIFKNIILSIFGQ